MVVLRSPSEDFGLALIVSVLIPISLWKMKAPRIEHIEGIEATLIHQSDLTCGHLHFMTCVDGRRSGIDPGMLWKVTSQNYCML